MWHTTCQQDRVCSPALMGRKLKMGNKYTTLAYAMAITAVMSAPALADSHEARIQEYVDSKIRG